jgi:hypothetical protein
MVNAARLAPLEEVLAELEGNAPAAAAKATGAAQMPAKGAVASETSHAKSAAREEQQAMARAVPERAGAGPVPASPSSMIARTAGVGEGLEAAQLEAIKTAIFGQEKFLGELIEHASRWEMSGGEVRLFFPTESRALAEMLQARDPMERLRNIASRILGQTVRVCVKLEALPAKDAATRTSPGTRELRARFEQDPIVRAMLERFGGRISEVKGRSED